MKTEQEVRTVVRHLVAVKAGIPYGDPRREAITGRIAILMWVLDLSQMNPMDFHDRNFPKKILD